MHNLGRSKSLLTIVSRVRGAQSNAPVTGRTVRCAALHAPYGLMIVAACLLAITGSGCATHANRLVSVRDAYYHGNLDTARSRLDKEIKHRKSDADVLRLERAMVDLVDGRPDQAEQTLRVVRDQFDFLEQKDVGESILSTVTDDNRLSYAGEDYEKILIRCFLSLSNLMHHGGDASAYALQVGEKQRQIIDRGVDKDGSNPKLAYKRVALGAYIHAAIQEATHVNYDEAARSIQLVANWEPEFDPAKDDLKRVTEGQHSAKGDGVVYVFGLVGRGPYKEERFEEPTSAALLIADRILTATSNHSLPPTIAPIKVPVVVRSHNRIHSLGVGIDGSEKGETETITDIGQLAVDQYQAVFPRVMARAVVRRVIKKGAVYATKEFANINHPAAELAMDLAGVAWEATESADTRCWGLLPDQIQVLRLELPAGEHQLSLTPHDARGSFGNTAQHTILVEDGRNTYVMACFPDDKLVGQVLVSSSEIRLD